MAEFFQRVSRMLLHIIVAGGAVSLLGACATTIVPPASVDRPQAVFVLDHGRHSSLVLPHPEGFVRYAFGDWGWYAEVDTGRVEASRAVLWPTRAGLGRSLTHEPATREGVRGGLRVGIQDIHEVPVATDRVATLRSSLDARHRAHVASAKHNAVYGLTFVEHPEPYAFWNNSNHKVAQWLRQLGCAIEGSAFWALWRVRRVEDLQAGDVSEQAILR
ncbi:MULTISPECIES: hypothetical protein [unclassified Guyparkeria]|uniref:hypothetical protein n=1 Tax=unclassified Guyparkeria TaxID=2626246 RepID=UPI00073372D6|nr:MULTISPECIES: hypothetical protein [unclassified Guyparkeria]KTG17553.1 hypothetical protein AUR63_07825 [Guyparkeria sp. XI15]OAE88367.1 hypothetical protein AWR35_07840 [Guyparkeria sp. WRN-7]